MGTIPAPNIAQMGGQIASAPVNALQEYARVAQLNQATQLEQQQTQAAQLENQQRQLDLKNQQIVSQIAPQHVTKDDSGNVTGYDWDGLAKDALAKGATPQYVNGLQISIAKARSDMAGATKAERDNHDAISSQALGMHEDLKSITDPTQRQQAYTNLVGFMKGHGLDTSGYPAQVPQSNDDLTHLEIPLGMHKQIVAEATSAADQAEKNAKAQNEKAQAGLNEIKLNLAKNSKAGDFDKQIDSIYDPQGLQTGGQNRMIKSQVNAALSRGDWEGAGKYIDQALEQQLQIGKEIAVNTNPDIQAGKVAVAKAEGQARADIEAAMLRGSDAATQNVPPHQVAAAKTDAMKAGDEFAHAKSVSDRLAEMMKLAKAGNVVSYQLLPQEGALQLVTSQGIKRINMAEIQNYGGGSLWQQMQGHFGKALSGKSIPDSVLDDMAEIQALQQKGATEKYHNDLAVINQTYGSTFKPVQMEGLGGTVKMKSPDGKTTKDVRAEDVDHYKSLGATVVTQ